MGQNRQRGIRRLVFSCVAVDAEGSAYAAGAIMGTGTYDFGNGVTARSSGNIDFNAVLVKYDASGTAQWARTLRGGINPTRFSSVAVDANGYVYTSGEITGGYYDQADQWITWDCGNGVSVRSGKRTLSTVVVLVKYDSSGDAQWAKSVTDGAGMWGSRFDAVATDRDGNVYAAGYFYGTDAIAFANGLSVRGTSSLRNILLVKYSSAGAAQWARSMSAGAGESRFTSVAADGNGGVYASGEIDSTREYDFGGVKVAAVAASYTHRAAVLARYDSLGRIPVGEHCG